MLLFLSFFLLAVLFCFTVPGVFLLTKSKINFSIFEKTILGTVLGFTFFTLLSYLLLVTKLSFLLIPVILFVNAIYFKKKLPLKSRIVLFPKKKLVSLILVFLFGTLGQMLVIAPSGLNLNGDLIFWSSHGHDGSWHIALMEEIKKGYPLQNPSFAGEKLINYHFFSDIAPADFSKYFKLSSLDLYFRFFPIIFSMLLGGLSFILGLKLGHSFAAGLWSAIFTYFAGSFGYIVTFLQNRTIGGESLFWASQVQSSIGNPPQIISSVIILAFLILFLNLWQEKKGFFICTLLAGTLIVFKVYAGVVLLLSLGVVGFWQLIRERRIQILSLFVLSTLLSLILYLPNTWGSNKFLIWEPWWFIRTMVVAPDKLNWIDLELRRQTYIAENNWKRVIQVELTAFLIFFFGNLGMRFLGLWYLVKSLKSIFKNYFSLLFLSIIIISFIFPLLFLQKGVASNTIQFFQYALLLLGIAAGITTAKLIGRVKPIIFKTAISILIIALAIPTQVALIYGFYSKSPLAKISSEELAALSILKDTKEESVILTAPYNKYLDLADQIPNIWDWSDTSYVAAFTGRRLYIGDLEQLDIMGYDFQKRLGLQKEVFETNDPIVLRKILKSNKIDYLYFPKKIKPNVDLSQFLKKIFENQQVEIWSEMPLTQ